jgi:hypothetical protein
MVSEWAEAYIQEIGLAIVCLLAVWTALYSRQSLECEGVSIVLMKYWVGDDLRQETIAIMHFQEKYKKPELD